MKKLLCMMIIVLSLVSSGCSKADNQSFSPQEPSKTPQNNLTEPVREPEPTATLSPKQLSAIEITPEVPSNIYIYSDGLGMFKYNSLIGFLDENGKVFIEPKYVLISNGFSEGHAIVSYENKNIVIIDKNGKEVFKSDKYIVNVGYINIQHHLCFHQNRAIVSSNNSSRDFHVIDTTGKEIYTIKNNEFFIPHTYYSCGRMIWLSNKKIMITDLDGNKIVKDFDTSLGFNTNHKLLYSDNLLSLPDSNNKWGVIDTEGNVKIDFTYEELGYPNDGLIPFMKYQKWGYIDYQGNVVIEPQYKKAYMFSNGLAAVDVDGRMGFINAKNEIVIEPAFSPSGFHHENIFLDNGLAVVGMGIIDRNGNYIISNSGINYNGGNMVSIGSRIYKIEGLD